MALIQNQKLLLHVKGIKAVRGNSFFIVEHDGVEYLIRQFPFQIDKPVPKALKCWVKDAAKGELLQDRSDYLDQLYRVGEEFPFRVRNDFTHFGSHPYYEVIDSNGIVTRLYNFNSIKLNIGDEVSCRVTEINDKGGLFVDLARVVSSQLCSDDSEKTLSEQVKAGDDGRELYTYESVLEKANQYFLAVLDGISCKDMEAYQDAADTYCSFCETILEKEYDNQPELKEKEKVISRRIFSIECLNNAIELNESNMSSNYLELVISKLNSRSLYKKEEKVLTSFFLVGISIGEGNAIRYGDLRTLIDTGVEITGYDKRLFKKLACFDTDIRQLESNKTSIDSLQSVALQLLLDGGMSSSTLAVHFISSLVPYAGILQDKLLDKAIDYILSGCLFPNVLAWTDIEDFKPQLIAAKIANARLSNPSEDTMKYTANGFIAYSAGKLKISPCVDTDSLKEVFCSLGSLATQIQVLYSDKVRIEGRVQEMMNCWQQILLPAEEKPTQIVDRSNLLIEGSEVILRLDSMSYEDNAFMCTVMDGTESIHGMLYISNMVWYRVSQAGMLLDGTGPVYLPAVVTECNSDGFIFSCINYLTKKIFDLVSVGDEIPCKLKSAVPNRGCVWLSKYGFNVYTPYIELPIKSYYNLQIDTIAVNGYINGTVLEPVDLSFYDNEAFCFLVDTIRVEVDASLLGQSVKSKLNTYKNLSLESIRSLMHLLELKADNVTDFDVKFNLLNVLKLMSNIIGDHLLCKYYKERIRQLGLLRTYLINGHVDMDIFFKDMTIGEDLYEIYPILKKNADLLSVLSHLNNQKGNESLMDLYKHAATPQAGKLAGLVLAYNLLEDCDIKIDSSMIRKEVVRLLNLSLPEADKSDAIIIGEEDYHTEFKTSIVYPADNNMLPDLAGQTRKIVSVIAGFLNADGGDLYIGVNNYGLPVGVQDDIAFLGSKDKFELELHQVIRQELGKDINMVLSIEWHLYDDKDVYVIHVPAYHQLVKFKRGEVVYCRQQSSTIVLDCNAANLQAIRKRVRFGQTITMPVSSGPCVKPLNEEQVKNIESERKKIVAKDIYEPFCCLPHNQFELDFANYLNYLTTDEYLISDHPVGDKTICLSFPFENDDKQLVHLYKNGNMVRTPLKILGRKKTMYPYKFKNYKHTDLLGVAIVDAGCKIFVSLTRDGQVYGKVIDLDTVQESKDICSMGKPYLSVPFDKFTACVQVPECNEDQLSRITENRTTHMGYVLNGDSFRKELVILGSFVPLDMVGLD